MRGKRREWTTPPLHIHFISAYLQWSKAPPWGPYWSSKSINNQFHQIYIFFYYIILPFFTCTQVSGWTIHITIEIQLFLLLWIVMLNIFVVLSFSVPRSPCRLFHLLVIRTALRVLLHCSVKSSFQTTTCTYLFISQEEPRPKLPPLQYGLLFSFFSPTSLSHLLLLHFITISS